MTKTFPVNTHARSEPAFLVRTKLLLLVVLKPNSISLADICLGGTLPNFIGNAVLSKCYFLFHTASVLIRLPLLLKRFSFMNDSLFNLALFNLIEYMQSKLRVKTIAKNLPLHRDYLCSRYFPCKLKPNCFLSSCGELAEKMPVHSRNVNCFDMVIAPK